MTTKNIRAGVRRLALVAAAVALIAGLGPAEPVAAAPSEERPASRVVYGEPTGGSRRSEVPRQPKGVVSVPTRDADGDIQAAYLSYTLRHSFSLVPSPYAVPYSCFTISGGYQCRAVYGYEEGGSGGNYDVDFLVTRSNVKSTSSFVSGYARELVYDGGQVYQGCTDYNSTYWVCDYWTPNGSRRQWSNNNGYWIDVLKDWSHYTVTTQLDCAATIASVWVNVSDYADIGYSCFSEPFNP